MTLIKFEPLKELETLSDRMHRYFEDFPSFGFDFTGGFSPRIDISEDEKNVYVEAELPGLKKDDLKITLQDNILTLKGEKKKEIEKKEKNYYRNERSYGSFQRSFTLPVEVDSNNVDAHFENGTLTLKMEKLQPAKTKAKEIELK
ncbi:MAG: Hsp20/alpha crystallin family protein [Ignavibacteriales bacterium]|nr:Hsp20/alpha crystallin family protein [Ignavibacteriales bacterium]